MQVSARALLSKLLRITLPPPPPLSPAPEVDNTTRAAEEEANNDPVLEWSYLLLFQVLKAGKGAALFGACGVRLSSSEESDGEGDTPPVLFSPEQLVVLHLWKQALDDAHARKPTAEDEDDGGAAATNVLLVDGGALCSDLAGRVVRAAAWLDAREGSRATMPPAADELMLAAGCAAAVRLVGGMLAAMDGCASCGQKEALVQQGLAAALLRLLRREGGQADGSIPVVAVRACVGELADLGMIQAGSDGCLFVHTYRNARRKEKVAFLLLLQRQKRGGKRWSARGGKRSWCGRWGISAMGE